MSSTSEARRLAALTARIKACRVCVETPSGAPLAHEPRPVLRAAASARLLIAGQAPGTRVHASGRPFTDPSGVRLRNWLGIGEDVFYDTERIAIVPMGFCFPGLDAEGSDLPPRRECAPLWQDAVMAALINVKLVLAIGRYAQSYHLRRLGLQHLLAPDMTETVRRSAAAFARERTAVLSLPHPSWRNSGWLKRNPWFDAEVLPLLRAELRSILAPAPVQASFIPDALV